MKIRKQLGSEAVQDLIKEASARVQQLPDRIVHDPWPSSHRVISDSVEPAVTVSRVTKE